MDESKRGKVRGAEPHDIDNLTDLWFLFAREEQPQCKPDLEFWAHQTLSSIQEDEAFFCLIAEDLDGNPVGFMDGYAVYDVMNREHVAVGRHLYVLPSWRGSLLATRLVLAAVHLLRRAGVRKIVTTPSTKKGEFWAGYGFEPYQLVLRRDLWQRKPLGQ